MKKVLVIVAHPDDETIWMGGTLLKNINKWETTIISLCRMRDKDRAPKFRKVCKMLKAKFFISDLEDERLNEIPLNEVVRRIKKYAKTNYDYIFTHGKNGEYGHRRHIDVNNVVRKMLKEKIISCKKVFFFSYKKNGRYCYPDKCSDKFINIEKKYFKLKKELIQNIYGFNKCGFEYICSRNKESFRIEGAA